MKEVIRILDQISSSALFCFGRILWLISKEEHKQNLFEIWKLFHHQIGGNDFQNEA